ncbi:hypothetical protein AB3X52_03145 [Nocardioides sp. DS6]|uniref:TfoX N-terminal domain-containing protein n=1 Tax=Nocardioides eburneus TaxID=3231482 RepID=A0ABV3SW44_9ACTN
MAYDGILATRIRDAVGRAAVEAGHEPREIAMFGGLCWTVNTHMAVGIIRDELMVSVGQDGVDAALVRGALRGMMGERPMAGTVLVDAADVPDEAHLAAWVGPAVARAVSKPPKPSTRR